MTIRPPDFQAMANELNYYFFLCDTSLKKWYYLSLPLLRLLRVTEQDFRDNPEIWMTLAELPGKDLDNKLENLSGSRENIEFAIPVSNNENEKFRLTIRISSTMISDDGQVYRLGSAEVENEGMVFKQEALQSRDNVIEISARIQKMLLTANINKSIRDLEIAAETIPSRKVDGDFYEFLQIMPGISDFIIGDVMGKGVPAALLAAAIKSAYFKSLITNGPVSSRQSDISPVLRIMDTMISRKLVELEKFLTLYYCRINTEKSLLSFIDAGHTWFVYYDSSAGSCWNVKGSNMPIGFTVDQVYRTFLLPFNNDDVLFFYSDGISEVRNSDGEMFGHERIRQLVNAHHHLTPAELLKKVLNVIFYFAAQPFDDDVTGVAIKSAKAEDSLIMSRSHVFSNNQHIDLQNLREQFSEDLSAAYKPVFEEDCTKLVIALIEACGNCIPVSTRKIIVEWKILTGRTEMVITYSGSDYEWYKVQPPSTGDFQSSGYGMYLIQQATDSSLLLFGKDNQKRLVMIKEFL